MIICQVLVDAEGTGKSRRGLADAERWKAHADAAGLNLQVHAAAETTAQRASTSTHILILTR